MLPKWFFHSKNKYEKIKANQIFNLKKGITFFFKVQKEKGIYNIWFIYIQIGIIKIAPKFKPFCLFFLLYFSYLKSDVSFNVFDNNIQDDINNNQNDYISSKTTFN